MSLLDLFSSIFGGSGPAGLRNRPDTMAYIKGVPSGFGADVLNGRIVRIRQRLGASDVWEVEPKQEFVTTRTVFGSILSGWATFPAGSVLPLRGIEDEYLYPLKNPGGDARDESLDYLPEVPKLIPLKVRGTVDAS